MSLTPLRVTILLLIAGSALANYSTLVMEGWTVHVNAALWRNEKAATETALTLLQKQLAEIVRAVPSNAVAELRQVPLWFSPEYPGVKPKAEYHPGAGWLREIKQRDQPGAQQQRARQVAVRVANFTAQVNGCIPA